MFDDILGSQEVFYEDEENPIEFEWHGDKTAKEEPSDYPLNEKMRQIVRDFIKDNLTDEDEEDCCGGNCDKGAIPAPGIKDDPKEAWGI